MEHSSNQGHSPNSDDELMIIDVVCNTGSLNGAVRRTIPGSGTPAILTQLRQPPFVGNSVNEMENNLPAGVSGLVKDTYQEKCSVELRLKKLECDNMKKDSEILTLQEEILKLKQIIDAKSSAQEAKIETTTSNVADAVVYEDVSDISTSPNSKDGQEIPDENKSRDGNELHPLSKPVVNFFNFVGMNLRHDWDITNTIWNMKHKKIICKCGAQFPNHQSLLAHMHAEANPEEKEMLMNDTKPKSVLRYGIDEKIGEHRCTLCPAVFASPLQVAMHQGFYHPYRSSRGK